MSWGEVQLEARTPINQNWIRLEISQITAHIYSILNTGKRRQNIIALVFLFLHILTFILSKETSKSQPNI